MSSSIYNEARGALKNFLRGMIVNMIYYSDHAGRKTIITNDVIYSLKK